MNTAALYLAAAAAPLGTVAADAAPFAEVSNDLSTYLFDTFPELEYTFTYTDEMNAAKAAFLKARGWSVEAYDRAMLHSMIEDRKAAIDAGLIDP